MNASRSWHTCTPDQTLADLEASGDGLTPEEAVRRQSRFGLNVLPEAARTTVWSLLLGQFKNVLILILLVAVALSALLGEIVESVVIAVIVLFAILLGFAQEFRAERALAALRALAAPLARVRRGGRELAIPARELVPGDLLLLRVGDRVPADARLLEAVNLQVNEAALTGESLSVDKSVETLEDPDLAIGDRRNLVFSGTDLTYGRGQAVVVETGSQTEFGRITGLLQQVETPRTPLQRNLDKVGRTLAVAASLVVILIAGLGVMRGEPILEMVLFGVALAVAVVPEALPAVVTISLAIGVQRLVRRHALVRRLPTVETLGSTAVICSDKTGTLTRDQMTARALWVAGRRLTVSGGGYAPGGTLSDPAGVPGPERPLEWLLRAAALANDARLEHEGGDWKLYGDPTEGALIALAAKGGVDQRDLQRLLPRVAEIPFSSERKRMTTLHAQGDRILAFTKGAAEVVLHDCTHWLTAEGPKPLEAEIRQQIESAALALAEQALRVLALAYKPEAEVATAERELTFLGLVGMIDPPRAEAREAIARCAQAGIKPVMITGDHPQTARAIADELGILQGGRVVVGRDLDALDDAQLTAAVTEISVYARVSPEHKLRVVTAWQRHGQVVAMTGDGVNDAPALKRADIGVAMGLTGTDVSREAADMTLTDDNFASIVGAVEEGRGIFSNIKKYLMYLLSSNIGEIGLMAGATLAGLPLPLSAVQILYVNLATDGLPALALAVDPPEDGLMRHPPRDPEAGVFTRPVVGLMLIGGLWSTLINLSLFTWALASGRSLAHAMTLTFLSLVLIQFFKAYSFRSDRRSTLHRPLANQWLNLAILWELMLLALVIHVPILEAVFGTYDLPFGEWLLVVGLAGSVVPVLDLAKWMVHRTKD